MSKSRNVFSKIITVYTEEGFLAIIIKSLQKLQAVTRKKSAKKRKIILLADQKNILDADWTERIQDNIAKRIEGPCTVAWVMSPPGESGGGHHNIFRFIKFLDEAGYRNHIYLYSTTDKSTVEEVIERIQHFYKLDPSNISWLGSEDSIKVGDAIFATGWETAYPVYNCLRNVKKFYFVQDFEPYFYPVGSEYVLAENTYKFGFKGITAGPWLTKKINIDYGMDCSYYAFGVDTKIYTMKNYDARKEIVFYARPITARRGFELGVMALAKFHEMHPDYIINFIGWDVSDYDIPFPYINHKSLKIEALAGVYNRSAAALVMSLTNVSLLPLELLATGTIPVVNEGENNRMVVNNEYVKYAQTTPAALARALHEVVIDSDLQEKAKAAATSVKQNDWKSSGEEFIRIFSSELRG